LEVRKDDLTIKFKMSNTTVIERLVIPSDLSNVSLVESLIDKVCADLNINEDLYGNVLIAVTEAVNNAIIHGNAFNSAKSVVVEVNQDDESFMFRITDEGQGFDFMNLPDPTAPENIEKENGRGIFLIQNLSDCLDFEENGKVAIITFDKDNA
jgi:serine/threonine-protein kinase RsbW